MDYGKTEKKFLEILEDAYDISKQAAEAYLAILGQNFSSYEQLGKCLDKNTATARSLCKNLESKGLVETKKEKGRRGVIISSKFNLNVLKEDLMRTVDIYEEEGREVVEKFKLKKNK